MNAQQLKNKQTKGDNMYRTEEMGFSLQTAWPEEEAEHVMCVIAPNCLSMHKDSCNRGTQTLKICWRLLCYTKLQLTSGDLTRNKTLWPYDWSTKPLNIAIENAPIEANMIAVSIAYH